MPGSQPMRTVGRVERARPVRDRRRRSAPGPRPPAPRRREPCTVHAVLLVDQRADPLAPTPRPPASARRGTGRRPRAVHVDPLDRHADLPGVGEGAERGLRGRPLRVDVLVDDQRVVAAVLQQHVGAGSRARLGDRAAGRRAADVGDDVDRRGGEPSADLRRPRRRSPGRPGGRAAATISANRRPVAGSARSACAPRCCRWPARPRSARRPPRPGRSTGSARRRHRAVRAPSGRWRPSRRAGCDRGAPARARRTATSVPAPASTPPRASSGSLPVSRRVERGQLVGRGADRGGRGVQGSDPRSAAGVRAQPACGHRGRRATASSQRSARGDRDARPTSSPVRGSGTVSSRCSIRVTPGAVPRAHP